MNSNSNSQQNTLKEKQNQKEDSEMTNINQAELLLFLQFYFTSAQQNIAKILSDKIIMKEEEIPKITSSFNFWLNFALNFKDTSFVNLLLKEKDDRAKFNKDKLKEIITIIVKFLYDSLNSEEAFNKMLKNNYSKLYELILRLKDIIDNVYNCDLRDEIFINSKNENNEYSVSAEDKNEKEVPAFWFEQKIEEDKNGNLRMPKIINYDNEIKEDKLSINQINNSNDNYINNNSIRTDIIMNNNIQNNNFSNNQINNETQINKNNDKNEINPIKIEADKIEEKGKSTNENNSKINNNDNNNLINTQEINNEKLNQKDDNSKETNNKKLPYKVSSPCLDYSEINKLFENFCYFTKFNLRYFQIVFYEKVGYAFLNYNGDFMWADEYTSYVLFEEENIKKLNLFNIMTDFSKYILKKKYNNQFFDFKDQNNRLRIFTYTIDGPKNKEKKGEKLFEDLSKIKTLVSRATPVLLNGQGGTYIACILLETKFSLYRQNFDFFFWKSDWNNNK